MPSLTYRKDNPANIRHHLHKLASYLPYERIHIVNPNNRAELENLIGHLQRQLDNLPTEPVAIQPKWAPYDEPFTRDMLVALAGTWPRISPSMLQTFTRQGMGDRYARIRKIVAEEKMPFTHVLYKGHLLHPRLGQRLTQMSTDKENACWQHILENLALPPTPEGWIPPDMR